MWMPKRGELYFGKGIILVEGISEEYLVPAVAEVLGMPLDDQGIIVCNIDSANFKPYAQLLDLLHIPWVLFTDGDYYELHTKTHPDTGKTNEVRVHHIIADPDIESHFRGHDQLISLLKALYELEDDDFSDTAIQQKEYSRILMPMLAFTPWK